MQRFFGGCQAAICLAGILIFCQPTGWVLYAAATAMPHCVSCAVPSRGMLARSVSVCFSMNKLLFRYCPECGSRVRGRPEVFETPRLCPGCDKVVVYADYPREQVAPYQPPAPPRRGIWAKPFVCGSAFVVGLLSTAARLLDICRKSFRHVLVRACRGDVRHAGAHAIRADEAGSRTIATRTGRRPAGPCW